MWFGRRHRVRRRWHWRRYRRRLHRFGPRRFRLGGFAGHFAAGRHCFAGQICRHPEMIPSRARFPPRGGCLAGYKRVGAQGIRPWPGACPRQRPVHTRSWHAACAGQTAAPGTVLV